MKSPGKPAYGRRTTSWETLTKPHVQPLVHYSTSQTFCFNYECPLLREAYRRGMDMLQWKDWIHFFVTAFGRQPCSCHSAGKWASFIRGPSSPLHPVRPGGVVSNSPASSYLSSCLSNFILILRTWKQCGHTHTDYTLHAHRFWTKGITICMRTRLDLFFMF